MLTLEWHRWGRSARVALILCALAAGGCRSISHGHDDLPNYQVVNPSLYRGGQPTREGFLHLKDMGIKTLVNLRSTQPDREWLAQQGFAYENRAMVALWPSEEDVIWFLRIAVDPQRAPVFVYCDYGADRSGLVVAMYRVVVEHWDRERAIQEMTDEDNGFLPILTNLSDFIRQADVDAIRTAVYDKSTRDSKAED